MVIGEEGKGVEEVWGKEPTIRFGGLRARYNTCETCAHTRRRLIQGLNAVDVVAFVKLFLQMV